MTSTAPVFDIEVLLPADAGVFILDHSQLDGPDVLGDDTDVGFHWVSVKDDATIVQTWRGATVDGPTTAVEVGTLSVSTVIDRGAFADTDLKPGTPIRLRAAGDHNDTLATLTLDNTEITGSKLKPRAHLDATATDAVTALANKIRHGAANPTAEGEPWPQRVARIMGSATVPVAPPTDEPLTLTHIDNVPASEVGLWTPGDWALATIQGAPAYRRTGFDISVRELTGLTPGMIYRVEVDVVADDGYLIDGTFFRGRTWDDYSDAMLAGEAGGFALRPDEGWTRSTAAYEFKAANTTEPLAVQLSGTFGIAHLRLIERQRVAWCSNIVTETNLARHLDIATATAGRGWYVDRDGITRIAAATGPVLAHFSDIHDASDPLHVCYTDITPTYGTEDMVNTLTLTNLTRAPDEESGNWLNVETTLGPFEDRVAAATWGQRTAELETSIFIPKTGDGGYWYNNVYVGGTSDYTDTAEHLAQAHLARLAHPRPRFNTITFNALNYPQLIASLDIYTRVQATREGRTQHSAVISIAHTITPTKWLTTLGLLEEDPHV